MAGSSQAFLIFGLIIGMFLVLIQMRMGSEMADSPRAINHSATTVVL